MKSSREMREQFADFTTALDATLDIAERIDTKIEFDLDLLPAFPCPDGMTEAQFLRAEVQRGAQERYGSPVPGEVQQRIDYELDISEHTVKFHVNSIMTKLDARSRTEAVVIATRLGLIPL